MRTLMLAAVAVTALSTAPALAQGCQGGMCGRPNATQAQATTPTPGQPNQPSGGCPCCRNMAMMHSQPQGGAMPGMNQGQTTPTPETPRP